MRSLCRRYYRVEQAGFGAATRLRHGRLTLRQDICDGLLSQLTDDIVLEVDVDFIPAGGYQVETDTILDVQPLAVKQGSDQLGEGVTRALSGLVLLLTARDAAGDQVSEAGHSAGLLSETVRFNRPGSVDQGEIILRVACVIKAGTRMTRPGPLAAHRVADAVSGEIRDALAALSEEEFAAQNGGEETLTHQRRPGRPKLLLVKEIMGQGAMHEKLLLPLQPMGMVGARSNIDLGNIPLVMSPLEALDGGVHALTCVGPSTKENSRHYWRDPLLLRALGDERFDLAGVVFVGSPAIHQQKFMVAARLGMLAEAVDADGVIVATEGYGNNHIDFAAHLEEIGKRGIPVIGVTFCGNFGPLISGNSHTRHLVDCAKSATGLENSILADNTMTDEDAALALAMLSALQRGEHISAAPLKWDLAVRAKNRQKLGEG